VLSIILNDAIIASSGEYLRKCPREPYKISNPIFRGIQKYTGINIISSLFAGEIAEMNISSVLKSKKTKIHFDLFSAGDFISGKIKGFSADIKNLSVEDFYISEVTAKSLCGFTDIDYLKSPAKLKTPMYIQFSSFINEKDFHKTFSSKKYSELLNEIPLIVDKKEIGKLKINSLNTKINGNKIFLSSQIGIEGGILNFKFPIAFETSIEAKNNSIYLIGFRLSPEMFGKGLGFIGDFTKLSAIKLIDLQTLNTNPYDIKIEKININDGKINVEGTVFIPENTEFAAK
jgi:hypothetical protein